MNEQFKESKEMITTLNQIKKELKRAKDHKNKFKYSTNKIEQKNLKDAIEYSLAQSENKINKIKSEIYKKKKSIEEKIHKKTGKNTILNFIDTNIRFQYTIINVIRCELLEFTKKIFKLKISKKNIIRQKLKTELSLVQSKYDEKQLSYIVNNNPEVQ